MTQTIEDIRHIRPGDQLILTDEQTISDLIEEGADGAMEGLQLEIHSVRHIRESEGLVDWFLAELTGYKTPLTFLAKIVDQEMDLRIYYQPDDIESGTRQDQLDRENSWLFEESAWEEGADDAMEGLQLEIHKEEIVPSELEMTRKFDQTIDDIGRVEFGIKGGTLYGEMREHPRPIGVRQPQFVSVTEYAAVEHYDRIDNPELIVLEIGGLDEDGDQLEEGGLMLVLQGANIDPNDMSLMSLGEHDRD